MKKWGFAISATGIIAHRMAGLLVQIDEVKLAAVHSRDLQKALHFKKKYGFINHYDRLDALAHDPQVDVVYIASPHPMHFEQVEYMLKKGKHVLCEKPITLNAGQARHLQALARENQVLLMEGLWTRFLPAIKKAQEVVAQGLIGPVTLVEASFGSSSLHVPRIAQKAYAGGALMDLGTYLLHFAALFLGSSIATINSSATLSPEGIDLQNAILMANTAGAMGLFKSSVINPFENEGKIYGEKGKITLPQFWGADQLHITYLEGETEIEKTYSFPHPLGDGFYYEVKAFIQALNKGLLDVPAMPMEESIRILKQMDSLRAQWGMAYPQDPQP